MARAGQWAAMSLSMFLSEVGAVRLVDMLEQIQTARSLNALAWVVVSQLDSWFEWCHPGDTEARLVLVADGARSYAHAHLLASVCLALCMGVTRHDCLAPPATTDCPNALVLSRTMVQTSHQVVGCLSLHAIRLTQDVPLPTSPH
jgi:hypothetical protein